MDDKLKVILLDLLSLTQRNANDIERAVMIGAVDETEAQKDERLSILRSLEVTGNGCEMTLARIKEL